MNTHRREGRKCLENEKRVENHETAKIPKEKIRKIDKKKEKDCKTAENRVTSRFRRSKHKNQ